MGDCIIFQKTLERKRAQIKNKTKKKKKKTTEKVNLKKNSSYLK